MNLCVIPARGGSKRIPLKNIRDFCAKLLCLMLSATSLERRFAQRKYLYQVRSCSPLSAINHNLVRLRMVDSDQNHRLIERLVLHLLASAVEAIRPNRRFPRQNPWQAQA